MDEMFFLKDTILKFKKMILNIWAHKGHLNTTRIKWTLMVLSDIISSTGTSH